MPKMKTNSSAKKRFSLTGSGKIKRKHAYKRHILTKKAKDRKRALTQDGLVCKADTPNVKFMLAI
jgi:large subunit ribosomal protein L35